MSKSWKLNISATIARLKIMTLNRYVLASFVMVISLLAPMTGMISPDRVNAQAVNLNGKQIQEVSTGYDTACAVIEGWPYCWGANDVGQLGNGKTSEDPATKPVAVTKDQKGKAAGPPICIQSFLFFCLKTAPGVPAVPPSAMANLEVEKVSVGVTHACAIASAKVYCWGDNEFGQLGNRSTAAYSAAPVKVDTQSKDETGKPKSALAQKEIIDVSAGEYFTCALASDGTVACWGDGEDGRLGNGSETEVNYPHAVVATPGTPLSGKKGLKLARASAATMCVLAVSESTFASVSNKGNPYCWGYGIGDGTVPGPGRVTIPCSKDTPTTRPTGQGVSYTYFSSSTPVEISGTQQFTQVDGSDYLTGLADNNRAYYWGMNGYKSNNTYISTTTCSVNPCTAQTVIQRDALNSGIVLAASKVKKNAGTKPGSNSRQNGKTIGSDHSKNGKKNHQNTQNVKSGPKGEKRTVKKDSNKKRSGSNSSKPTTCENETHYGYTADRTNERVGKMTPATPKVTALNQSNLSVFAGNIESGLFCATNASGTFCDANGTSMDEGQTGSNYTKQCSGGFLFIPVTCKPGPTGPQQVVSSGWLNGKTVQQLSTGLSGYTCALANNSIGCWGVNSSGQLGTGNTTNMKVPTALKLQ